MSVRLGAIALFLMALLFSCGDRSTVPEPEANPRAAAEAEYGSKYLALMVEFRDNAIESSKELDSAIAKGLPKDRKERGEFLLDLTERGDKRMEATLAKAKGVQAPSSMQSFHKTVLRFLQDFVDGNARYLKAARKGGFDSASEIGKANQRKMVENYEAMRKEGEALGIPMSELPEF